MTHRHRYPRGRIAVLTLLTTAQALAALLLPAALGTTVDLLLSGEREARSATAWSLVCCGLIGAEVVLAAVEAVVRGGTDAHTTARLRTRLVARVLAVGPARAGVFPPGDLVTRGTGVAAQAGTVPTALADTAGTVLVPLGGAVALLLIDPRLGLVFLAALPLMAVLLRAFTRSTAGSVAAYQRLQADIASRLVEAVTGARTIAAAGTEAEERARVTAPLGALGEQGRRMWRIHARATAQAATLLPLAQLAVVATGGLLLGAGELTVGGLLAAARYAVLAGQVGAFVGSLNRLVRGRVATRRLDEVLALPPVRHGARALPADGRGRLEFRGVTARRGDRAVLRDVDLVVPGGGTLAVVGRSGAGKSVLAALAGRLADPDAGEIRLDGVPLTELDRATLRREVGYAFERPALLGGTLGEAIALGARRPTPDRVAAAARAASADGFIRTLPDGYDTRCDAAPLSGGELQRVGLARAFAHGGRLLVLDDATSSLDTVTELRVGRALLAEGRARTRLVVAHRPATAARADLVAWLDEGRIRAVGTHRELWRRADYRAAWAEGAEGAEGKEGAEGATDDAGGGPDDGPDDGPEGHGATAATEGDAR
ncbi:ABC transporter ATP-binding protein [Streptomyces sp. 4N509B]|uniref:ABC transporter ATP-binding protein n=1 Tax=Streptomyces sp. 4N509B TaxID=3457413 RepID=UPI003FD567E7